jgi:DNA polymerase III delta prime subunit
MDDLTNAVWPEKYRPKNVKSMILPIKLRNYFNKIIESQTIPNMIFHSVKPGSGKSSCAKAICRDLGVSDYLYVNTSLNRGIDTLRDEIQDYATTLSITGNAGLKVAILDEFDGAGEVLQRALRASIEEFTTTCRFILTCNNLSKIIEPIRSRCEPVDFNFMEHRDQMIPNIYKRLCNILKTENFDYNDDTLKKIVVMYYPDIRHMIKLCQQFTTMCGVISDDIFKFRQIEEELADLIMKRNITAARKYITDKGYDYDSLYRFIFDVVVPKIEDKNKRALAILTVDDYMRGSRDSLDKEITFTACMLKLCEVL